MTSKTVDAAQTLLGHLGARSYLRSRTSGMIASNSACHGRTQRGLWEGYISVLVLTEVSRAHESIREKIAQELKRTSLPVLEESSGSLSLAQAYVQAGAIPSDYEDDARHIAIATVNDINVVVSWNFKHMVNVERKIKINSVNVREGFPLIDIVSPLEVSHEEA